jgi:dTDP-4-dehydrorhamnose reductase
MNILRNLSRRLPSTVVVFGATGMLGSVLVPFLKTCGYRVIAVGHKAHNSDEQCDLLDVEMTKLLISRTQPNAVVNLVALTNVDQCEKSPNDAYLRNVKTTENLTIAMQSLAKPYLVHISTDQVYDHVGASSEDNVKIMNFYAMTKYASELVAQRVHSTVLRTNFFGPSEVNSRLSFSDWVVKSIVDGTPITVFKDITVNPVHMTTLAEVIERVITSREKAETHGIFNVGTRDAMSKADLAFRFATTLKLPTEGLTRGFSTDSALRAYRPKNMWMDCARFETTFEVLLPELKDEIEKLK